VAHEAVRPVLDGVEPEQVVLEQRAGTEREAAQQGRGQEPLAAACVGRGVHRQRQEPEQHQLLGLLVRGQRVERERRREQRPDREGQDRSVHRQALEPGAAARQPDQVDDQRQRQEQLRREDGDEAGGRDGGEQRELRAVQVQRVSPRSSPLPGA
jgi:hypothetical protein